MKRFINLLYCVSSGILFGLSMPNFLLEKGNIFLGFISMIPLYLALCQEKKYKYFLIYLECFCLISNVINYLWLTAFMDYSYFTILGVCLGYGIYYFILSFFLYFGFNNFSKTRPIIITFIFVIYEYLKSLGSLGFPWNLAGYIFYEHLNMIQIVDITGIWFLSLIVYFFQFTVANMIFNLKSKTNLIYLAVSFFLFFITYLYGINRLKDYKDENKKGEEISFALIQQNLDPWTAGGEESVSNAMDVSKQVLDKKLSPDMFVWSETTLPEYYNDFYIEGYYKHVPSDDNNVIDFIKKNKITVLSGAPMTEDKKSYNSTVLLDKDANLVDWYAKQHLVPYGERVLLYDALPFVRWFARNILHISKGWDVGNRDTVFKYKDFKFATLICFEDSFFDMGRKFSKKGIDFIVNITNNSWSKKTYAQTQHYVAARFRPIELRKPLIRSTNSGLTAIILPSGKVLNKLPMFKKTYLFEKLLIQKNTPQTFYSRYGDWIIIVLTILLALAYILKSRL